MTMESNLKWNLPIPALSKKLGKSAGLLSKIFHYMNKKKRKTIYYSIVPAAWNFGLESDCKTTIKPLQTQNKS